MNSEKYSVFCGEPGVQTLYDVGLVAQCQDRLDALVRSVAGGEDHSILEEEIPSCWITDRLAAFIAALDSLSRDDISN